MIKNKFFCSIISIAAASIILPQVVTQPAAYAKETSASLSSDPIVERASNNLNCKYGESKEVQGQDGLIHEIGCFEIGKTKSSSVQKATRSGHWSPYLSKTVHCGSSYARNQEVGYLLYRGTVHASGEWATGSDCGGTGRVYRASIAYKRDGKTLSSAMVTAGQTKSITALDTVVSDAPRTQFYYNFIIGP